jgi:hypothetical protein
MQSSVQSHYTTIHSDESNPSLCSDGQFAALLGQSFSWQQYMGRSECIFWLVGKFCKGRNFLPVENFNKTAHWGGRKIRFAALFCPR